VSLKSSLISSISSTTENELVMRKRARKFAYCRMEPKPLLGARCTDLAYAPPQDELQTAELETKGTVCPNYEGCVLGHLHLSLEAWHRSLI
jgi:hypothetical protein